MSTYVLPLMCYGGYPALRSVEAQALAELTNQLFEEDAEICVTVRGDGKNPELVEFDTLVSRYVPMIHMASAFVGGDPLCSLSNAIALPRFFGKGDILVLVEEGQENAVRLYVEHITWMHGKNVFPAVTFKTFKLAIPWHIRWWNEYIVLCQAVTLAQGSVLSSLLHA